MIPQTPSTPTPLAVAEQTAALAERARIPRLRRAYVLAATAGALLILLQVFLAGAGVFAGPSYWPMHRLFGMILTLVPLVLVALAFAARVPRRFAWLGGLLFVLVGLQPALTSLADQLHAPLLAALHPVNAVVIFALTALLSLLAWQRYAPARA